MPLLRSTGKEIVFGRRVAERVAGGVVGAIMLALTTVLLVMVVSSLPPSAGHSPLERMQPIAFSAVFEMLGLGILIIFQITEDLILDLTARTYRFRSGLPLFARWHAGPFSDIEDIVLRKVSTKQGTAYRVALTWHGRTPGFWTAVPSDLRDTILDMLSPKPRAEAMSEMELIAGSLALPGITGHDEVPEHVRQRSLRMTVFGTAICMLIFVALYGPLALLEAQMDTGGRAISGSVTDIRRGAKTTVVGFTYQVNGRTLNAHENVMADTYQKVGNGDPVTVTYLPDYPNTCRTNYSVDSFSSAVGTLALTVGGTLVFGILYSLYKMRRQPVNSGR